MKFVVIAMMALALAGCTVTTNPPDRITIDRDGTVTIDNDRNHSGKNSSYKHCPPGQAKKGNC